MVRKARRAMVIGADSAMLRFVDKFAEEGSCPTFAGLLRQGTSGIAYPSHPTFTPTNWTTIATGCDTDVHGVAQWVFDTRASKAEHLWTAAARAGKRSLLMRYTCGYPSTHPLVTAVEAGRPGDSPWMLAPATWYSSAPPEVVSTGLHGRFESERTRFEPPQGWRNLPKNAQLAAQVTVRPKGAEQGPVLWLLALGPARVGCDRLLICEQPDASQPLCSLALGEWSGYLRLRIPPGGTEGAFRLKLLAMSPDLSEFRLYRTMVYATSGFSDPPQVAEELVAALGPRLDNTPRLPLAMCWHDTYFEELEEHLGWLAEASLHLLSREEWTLFFTQCHTADYVAHEKMAWIDPVAPGYDPAREEEGWEVWRRCYQALDQWVARILEAVDEQTLVLFVSDHGHVAHQKSVLTGNALAEAGLMAVDAEGRYDRAASALEQVAHLGFNVRTRSRFEEGCVAEEDYESVRERAIQVLRAIRDPENGRFPLEIVLGGEDCAFLGLSREQADIVALAGGGYASAREPVAGPARGHYLRGPDAQVGSWGGAQGIHGDQPAWTSLSLGTISACFALAGVGVRENLRLSRPICLRDVAPTLAHLLGLASSAQATGRVLHEALS